MMACYRYGHLETVRMVGPIQILMMSTFFFLVRRLSRYFGYSGYNAVVSARNSAVAAFSRRSPTLAGGCRAGFGGRPARCASRSEDEILLGALSELVVTP